MEHDDRTQFDGYTRACGALASLQFWGQGVSGDDRLGSGAMLKGCFRNLMTLSKVLCAESVGSLTGLKEVDLAELLCQDDEPFPAEGIEIAANTSALSLLHTHRHPRRLLMQPNRRARSSVLPAETRQRNTRFCGPSKRPCKHLKVLGSWLAGEFTPVPYSLQRLLHATTAGCCRCLHAAAVTRHDV